jgi:hypothetical protein
MLPGGNYLEITAEIGTPPSGVPTPRSRRVERYDGLHIIAFDADDLPGVEQRIRAAGFSTPGVVTLERDVDTPEGTRTARFERVVAESDRVEELLQVARHLTPQYVFQDRYLRHPNGAQAITEAIFCVADPAEYVARYCAVTGRPAERRGAVSTISLPTARICIVAPADLDELLPGASAPVLPCMAGFVVSTASLDGVATLLAERGIPNQHVDGRILVPAGAACGATLLFEGP